MPIGAARANLSRVPNFIPDTEDLHARYDATELSLSDGDSVSTWPDETGNGFDLTAGTAPSFATNVQNSNPVVRFDGVDDFLDVSFSALSQPVSIFIVIANIDKSSSQNITDGNTDSGGNTGRLITKYEDSGPYFRSWSGSSWVNGSDTNSPLILSAIHESTDKIRENGTQTGSASAGDANLDGFTLGIHSDESSAPADIDVGEVLLYNAGSGSINVSGVESYLSDKWDIAI